MSGEDDDVAARLGRLSDPLSLLRGLFEHAPVPYAIFGADGRVVVVNAAYIAMFGRAPPVDYDLFADEIAAQTGLTTLFRRAFAGETVRTPTFWYDPAQLRHVEVTDAKRVAIRCTLFPLAARADDDVYVTIAYQDLTAELGAREDAEARQREAEAAQHRSEFLASASAILSESLDVDDALRRVAGLAVPRIADWCVVTMRGDDGVFRRIVVLHRDPARKALAARYAEAFPPGQHRDEELQRVLVAGAPLLIEHVDDAMLIRLAQDDEHLRVLRGLGCASSILVPITVDGVGVGVVSLVRSEPGRPFTHRDVGLAADLAARTAVALRVVRLFSELRAREHELQEAVRVRDDFLSVAGHELKTPLAAVLMHVEGLQRHLPDGPDAAKLAARLAKAESAGQRLASLIDQLLDVSRITAGRVRLEPEELDLVAVVNDVVARQMDAAAAAHATIVVGGDAAVVGAWDPLRLEQVVANLLGNAIKYGRDAPIEVFVTRVDDAAVLRVRDHGIGIAAEQQARIFERFERAVASREYGGFGLGLWITREIVHASGGTISVESAPGAGALFTVTLPLRPR